MSRWDEQDQKKRQAQVAQRRGFWGRGGRLDLDDAVGFHVEVVTLDVGGGLGVGDRHVDPREGHDVVNCILDILNLVDDRLMDLLNFLDDMLDDILCGCCSPPDEAKQKRLGAGLGLEQALGSIKGSEVGIVLLVADAERFLETLRKDLARRVATFEVDCVGDQERIQDFWQVTSRRGATSGHECGKCEGHTAQRERPKH